MAKLTMVQAINLALTEAMERDDRVVVLGQDVGEDGGVFRVTDGLHDRFGPERVIDTPLAESAIMGTAIGMAIGGLRPVAEMQFSGFAYLALPQLENHASRYRTRTRGQYTVPLVLRMPYGGGVRALEHHSESKEVLFGAIPGCKTVIPSGPRAARALLAAAIDDPDPVVFLEPKRSYRAFREEVPEERETYDLCRARVVRQGQDVTLVAWGAMMRPALRAAETVEQRRGISVELVDLQTISPIDGETIGASVRKTGRCVVVQEAARSFSVSSEVVAQINDRALMYLEAPVARVTHYDIVTPQFAVEHLFLPDEADVVEALERTLDF